MHVLMTSDTLGGVWTYTQELVRGLVSRGHRVTLVTVGNVPRPEQTSWMAELSGLDFRPSAYRLEWMQKSGGPGRVYVPSDNEPASLKGHRLHDTLSSLLSGTTTPSQMLNVMSLYVYDSLVV